MGKYRILFTLVSLMCVNGLVYGEPAKNMVENQAQLDAAKGEVDVVNKSGIAVIGNKGGAINYLEDVSVTIKSYDSKASKFMGISAYSADVVLGKTTLNWDVSNDNGQPTKIQILGIRSEYVETAKGTYNGTNVTLGNDSNITITANNDEKIMYGYYVENTAKKSEEAKDHTATINTGDNTKLNLLNKGNGVVMGADVGGEKAIINIGVNNEINVDGVGSVYGIFANKNGTVNAGNDLKIKVTSTDGTAYGIYASGDSSVTLDGANINAEGKTASYAILASNATIKGKKASIY